MKRDGGRLHRYECRACATARVQDWRRRKRAENVEKCSRDILRGQRSANAIETLTEELIAAFGSARGLARYWVKHLMAEQASPTARRETLRQFRAICQLLITVEKANSTSPPPS